MKDFWRLVIQDEYFAVRQPAIEANNFELKPALITMVQQHQYTRNPSEDPNEHMRRILRMENTMKLNGVRCHTPIPGPTRLADPNRVWGARPYTWDSLPVFFLNTKSKYHIHIKRTTTGVVSIKIYTHILSPIYIYRNCTFTFTNQSAGHTVMNPY